MLARDIMTVNPVVVTPDAPVYEAAAIMRDANVGFTPVVDDRESMQLKGVLTDRDIAVRCVAGRRSCDGPVGECMTAAPVDAVGPDAEVHEVVALMERQQVRRVPVVDRDGRLVGVIAQADLALSLGPDEPAVIEALVERISAPSVAAPSFQPPAGRATPVS
jgi:CBS domain-containing protein